MFFATVNGIERKVFFKHTKEERTVMQKDGKEATAIHPIATTCRILDKETNNEVAVGVAKCHPNDNFEYERGRKTALTRAIKNTGFTRDQRATVWAAYNA